MMTDIELTKNSIIRIIGPARIDVVEGRILIVGAVYGKGSSVVVHSVRSYGVKVLESAKLRITLGNNARIEYPSSGEEVIDEWLKIAEDLTRSRKRPIVAIVTGPVESGKTTLTAFITNYMIQKDMKVALIEGDIGQEDLALPATIAMAMPKKTFVWQKELVADFFKFIGYTSPQYCYGLVIKALGDLLAKALSMGVEAVLINTDGWVSSPQALEYKLNLIRWLRPTHVIVLDSCLAEVFESATPKHIAVIKAPRPAKVRERSREERRKLRSEAYMSYFKGAKERTLRIDEVKVIGSCVLSGKKIEVQELLNNLSLGTDFLKNVVYASLYGNLLNLVVKGPVKDDSTSFSKRELNIVREDDFRGYLVAILNSELEDVALGIIKNVSFKEGVIKVLTPWSGEISALIMGRIKLTSNYEDVVRVGRCVI
ncbi:MAG: hypothetical protein J7J20_02455 [Desulfurococcales archaeon]|nr:hypothetical protein [Desulfurococcales archaeon]